MEKEFELDEAALKAIAEQVQVDTDSIAAKVAEKMIEAQKDQPANKGVGGQNADEVTADSIEKMSPQERTRAHLKAYFAKDTATVAKFNQHAVDTNVKAGYMNATTTADGAGFVPDADMLADVFSLG